MRKDTNIVRPVFAVFEFDVGLRLDAVEVLVEAVQQEGQQLLRVLLVVARKLRREPADGLLEVSRNNVRAPESGSGGSGAESNYGPSDVTTTDKRCLVSL